MLAKLVNGNLQIAGGKLLQIGDEITVNPREEDFIRAGYKPVVGERLEEREGYYQVAEYEENENEIVATYHYEEIIEEELND